ncbi:MAG: TPM domain-containing protein [Rubrobacter sp.]|nr:TPM domain-containing protein [Rubrobacter sp.]
MDEKAHTGKPLGVLFFVAATAVFLFSVQASSLAQRSCLTPSRGDAARAMSVSEEARVRRALEEVREDSGREVFVCHLMYIGRDQCVDYLGQRRSFGAEDAVIQVSNAERTMGLVQAPGLTEAQTLRLSDSMTAEFRRNGYAAGLIHGTRELEDRLPDSGTGHRDLEERLREVRGEGRANTLSDPRDSGLAIGLVCAGTAAVLLFLFLFLRNERRHPPAPKDATSQPDDSSGEQQRPDSGSALPRPPPDRIVKSRDVRHRLPGSSRGGSERPRKP